MTSPLLAQFVAEATELLAEVDAGLLRLEQAPDDDDLVNAVFRAAHTLKGSSGLFDLPALTELTHAAEDLLDAVRSGAVLLDGDMVDHLLAAFDTIRSWMPVIAADGRLTGDVTAGSSALAGRLRACVGGPDDHPANGSAGRSPGDAAASASATVTDGPLPRWVLDLPLDVLESFAQTLTQSGGALRAVRYRPEQDCFFRGEDPVGLVRQVPATAVLALGGADALPPLEDLDEFSCLVWFTLLTRADVAELEHLFRYVRDEVEIVTVTGPALGHLLAGPDEDAPEPLDAAPRREPTPDEAAALALLAAQLDVVVQLGTVVAEDDALSPAFSVTLTRSVLDTAVRAGTAAGVRDAARSAPRLDADGRVEGGLPAVRDWLTGLLRRAEDVASTPSPLVPRPRRGEHGHRTASGGGDSSAHAEDDSAPGPGHDPDDDAAPDSDDALPIGSRREPRAAAANGEPRGDDPGAGARVLKVEQAKVDRLMDLAGQLVVAKNALPFVADEADRAGQRVLSRRIKEEYAVISRVSEELQHAVMDVRMLPVSAVFARAPRLVRDLGRRLGKSVRLVQEGEETAADKDVIEVLAEPLMHLIRNSLDHGIETPADRVAAGKPAEATLELRAEPDGDAVVVEIRDDGRGIDVDAVKRRAYERGVIGETDLEGLDDDAAAQLVFAPGFSTAAQVSEVSGRGVGMDVVRSTIERLGGRVTLHNRPGQGLSVRLRLPLTMAISRVLLIAAAGQRFGVPIDDVIETVRVPRGQVSTVAGRPVLVLRERITPLADLAALLDLPPVTGTDEISVLVVRTPTGPLGLVVDRFHHDTDVILKPLEGLLVGTSGYCGTALLGDGLVLLVLDVKELNDLATELG